MFCSRIHKNSDVTLSILMGDSRPSRYQLIMNEKSSNHESTRSSSQGERASNDCGFSSRHETPRRAAALTDEQPTVISSRGPVQSPHAEQGGLSGSLIGTSLGHFELEALVGSGGMGTVYRANDTMLGRTVAVKVLTQDHHTDEETLRRFKNEAQSAARLDHENIARVYYVGEDHGLHYIVYEYIEGTNIRDLVEQRGAFPLDQAISYTLQVAEALAHASERDVVHRDIKPSNILVTPAGQAKVVDMGLARLHQVEHSGEDLTASGVTLGTFDFISPEQALDPRSADVRSDMYSLGCTLFYMLAGRPPFPDGTVLQKLMRHQGDAPPDPREFRSDLPDEVSRITAKMLAKSPDDRYQLPSELIGELLVFAQRAGIKTSASQPTVWLASSRKGPWFERHLPWFIPVAGLFLVVLAVESLRSPPSGMSQSSGQGFMVAPPPIEPKRLPRAVSSAAENPVEAAGDLAANRPPTTKPTSDPAADEPAPNPPADMADVESPPKESASEPPLETGPAVADRLRDHRRRATDDARLAAGETAGHLTADDGLATSVGPADRAGAGRGELNAASIDVSDGPMVASGTIVRIVGSAEEDSSAHTTIKSALESAVAERATRGSDDGILIRLRYNGTRRCRPLDISETHLTIEADGGFTPVIEFRPDSPDPDKYPRSMITVDSGRLTLTGVALVMSLPPQPASGGWSLLEAIDAKRLQLTDCSMTIRNSSARNSSSSARALHEDVSFLNVTMKAVMQTMPDDPSPQTKLAITLTRCVARGEATLLHTRDVQWVHLQWNNGLLVTTEHLIASDGATHQPRQWSELQIDLRHLTVMTQAGFCLMTNPQDSPYQLKTKIDSAYCIFMGESTRPFVHQSGIDTVEEYRQFRLFYGGKENFYEGYQDFWWIEGNRFESEPVVMNYDDWKNSWNGSETLSLPSGSVRWQGLPEATKPVSSHTTEDYALASAARNPDGTGEDAGAQFDRLPKFPRDDPRDTDPDGARSDESGPKAIGS